MDSDDIVIEPPEDNDYEAIPTGAYGATLEAFKVVDKPEWKLASDLLHKPDKEPDKQQWAWHFTIASGEFEGLSITDFTSRSWHERSKAAAHACALLDVQVLPRGQGFTTGKLVGRPCQVWVVSKENSKGEERSYVDKVLALPKRRQNPAHAPVQEAPQEPAEQPEAPAPAFGPHAFQGKQRTAPCTVCQEGAGSLIHATQQAPQQQTQPVMAGASDDPETSDDYWEQIKSEGPRGR